MATRKTREQHPVKQREYPTKTWTKDDLRKIIKMWPDHSIVEMSKELEANYDVVSAMGARMRRLGVPLEPKHRGGYIAPLIAELLAERKRK